MYANASVQLSLLQMLRDAKINALIQHLHFQCWHFPNFIPASRPRFPDARQTEKGKRERRLQTHRLLMGCSVGSRPHTSDYLLLLFYTMNRPPSEGATGGPWCLHTLIYEIITISAVTGAQEVSVGAPAPWPPRVLGGGGC